jgi:hypothetical protein
LREEENIGWKELRKGREWKELRMKGNEGIERWEELYRSMGFA